MVVAEAVDSGIDLDEPDASRFRGRPGKSAGRRRPTGIEVVDVLTAADASAEELSAVEIVDSGVALGAPAAFDEPLSDESVIRTAAGESGIDLDEAIIVDSEPADLASGHACPTRPIPAATGSRRRSSPASTCRPKPSTWLQRRRSGRGRTRRTRSSWTSRGRPLAAGRLASEAEEVDLTEMRRRRSNPRPWTWAPSATFPVAPPEPPSAPSEIETTRPTRRCRKASTARRKSRRRRSTWGRPRRTGAMRAEDFFEESEALSGGACRSGWRTRRPPDSDEMEEATETPDEEAELEERGAGRGRRGGGSGRGAGPSRQAEKGETPLGRRRLAGRRCSWAASWPTACCLGLWLFNDRAAQGLARGWPA